MNLATARITATLWDCGGVFLTNGWDHRERRHVIDHFGLNYEEFEERHEKPNDAWERGHITIHEYLRQTAFYKPRQFSQDEFIARMKGVSKVIHPELLDFVKRLRCGRKAADRIGTYLLSNESRELMQYRISQLGLAKLFDAYIVSAYIGRRKPGADFFECALDIVQHAPQNCVFIDDREENVAAASKLGIHGIQMKTPQQTIGELTELGIDIN